MSRVLKDSGIIGLGKIPASRDVSKIFFMCEDVYAGGTPDTGNESYYGGDIPRIASGKCQDCDIFDETKFITEEGLNNSSTKLIPENTTLLAMTGATCGKTGFLRIKGCANQSVTSFVENKNKAYGRYLYYGLQTINIQIVLNKTGGAQGGINVEDCKNLKIPVPPLAEQQQIADYLDKKCSKINEQKENYEKSIELLKEYKQSLITEAVTKGLDKNVEMEESGLIYAPHLPKHRTKNKLKQIVTIPITDGTHNTPTYEDKDKGSPFLSSKDITKGYIDWSNIKYITKELHEKLQKEIAPKRNDILLAKNGTTGIAALVDTDEIFDIYVTLAVIRPNTDIVYPKYLLYFINSSISKQQFDEHIIGIGVPNLHLNVIERTKIFIPPLTEQKGIADYLDKECSKIDKVIAYREQMIEKLEEYKKSLIYECVTGKKEIK